MTGAFDDGQLRLCQRRGGAAAGAAVPRPWRSRGTRGGLGDRGHRGGGPGSAGSERAWRPCPGRPPARPGGRGAGGGAGRCITRSRLRSRPRRPAAASEVSRLTSFHTHTQSAKSPSRPRPVCFDDRCQHRARLGRVLAGLLHGGRLGSAAPCSEGSVQEVRPGSERRHDRVGEPGISRAFPLPRAYVWNRRPGGLRAPPVAHIGRQPDPAARPGRERDGRSRRLHPAAFTAS